MNMYSLHCRRVSLPTDIICAAMNILGQCPPPSKRRGGTPKGGLQGGGVVALSRSWLNASCVTLQCTHGVSSPFRTRPMQAECTHATHAQREPSSPSNLRHHVLHTAGDHTHTVWALSWIRGTTIETCFKLAHTHIPPQPIATRAGVNLRDHICLVLSFFFFCP